MSVVRPVHCLFAPHQPDPRKVRWDGLVFHAKCRYCGCEIEHVSRGNWRASTEDEPVLGDTLRPLQGQQ